MIFDADMDVVAAAARRWQERSAIRDARAGRSVTAIEAPERIEARLNRLKEAATPAATMQLASEMTPPNADVLREIGLERTIGASDFQNIAFLELALAVSRFVGRINIKSSPTRNSGFGTGSMVSPRLLLTNNHVLPNAESARFSEVEFDYQLDRSGRQLQSWPFALQPDIFFMTDKALDFSLVAVADRSKLDRDLKHYGWSRLIAEQGKILIGEHVNIIQHPRGQFKQFVSRENEVVDILEDHLHYVTDTEPGSSGSPVYNDQWEIVALHHAGVPRMTGDRYIDKSGNVWDGADPEDIDWIANEGVRVSKLVKFVEAQPLDGERARLRDDLLSLDPPHPLESARQADVAASGTTIVGPGPASPGAPRGPVVQDSEAGAISFTVPLRITVRLGEPEAPVSTGGRSASATGAPVASPSHVQGFAPAPEQPRSPELASALAELGRAATRPYYDAESDGRARNAYYEGVDATTLSGAALFRKLSELVTQTHKTVLRYAPAKHVYPWVDLHRGSPMRIRSIYSGKGFDPAELIEADFRIEAERARLAEAMATTEASLGQEAVLDLLEAQLPYNCEHVVPQSWFEKREPMRGDLHHLFACESGCNSFRGNSPYFDYPDFEEALRDACGKKERSGFEPSAGKGAVARATLYFLLRYPGLVGNGPVELSADRLATLLTWHRRFPVDAYERHRNAAIFEKQGNRNPLIDYPEWAGTIDFSLGFASPSRAPGSGEREVGARNLAEAVAAISGLEFAEGWRQDAALEAAQQSFGRYDGLPAQVALLADGRKLKLLSPLTYVEEGGQTWPGPGGAIVDGASIPRVFWTLIGGPLEGRYRDASIIHDVYCVSRSRSWRDTHRMFYDAMRCSGLGDAKAKVMYYAVFRFGPRWELAQEAMGTSQRLPTDADAATILADAEAIYAHGLDLAEIENLAEARNRAPSIVVHTNPPPLDPAALNRARLLVVTGGQGTAEDLEVVAREAAGLPGYVMARFERKKIRILACRESVTDFERSLRGQTPRGWEGTGRTWDDVPGTYLDGKKRVVIATVQGPSGRAVPSRETGRHGSISLTVHEALHGYDYSGGHAVLADQAFGQARDADITGLDAYQRQAGQAGLEETFAESGARFVAEPDSLKRDCPNLFAYWQARPAAIHEMAGQLELAPAVAAEAEADAPIGLVEQHPDGALFLHLRAEGPGGAIGHAAFELPPGDSAYDGALGQLGPTDGRQEATVAREALLRPFIAPAGSGRTRRRGSAPNPS